MFATFANLFEITAAFLFKRNEPCLVVLDFQSKRQANGCKANATDILSVCLSLGVILMSKLID